MMEMEAEGETLWKEEESISALENHGVFCAGNGL
jgi:hypothetical protein